MNAGMKLLRTYLANVIREATEAGKDDRYGQFLFAQMRKDLSRSEKAEVDTKEERHLWYALRNHYNGRDIDNVLSQLAPGVLDAIEGGKYLTVLAPPASDVYRFLNVELATAAGILGMSPEELSENPNKVMRSDSPGVLNPSGERTVMSWTTDILLPGSLRSVVAAKYAGQAGYVSMILKGHTSMGRFFMNPEGVKNVRYLPAFAYSQSEVMSYGPVPYAAAAWYVCSKKTTASRVVKALKDTIAAEGPASSSHPFKSITKIEDPHP